MSFCVGSHFVPIKNTDDPYWKGITMEPEFIQLLIIIVCIVFSGYFSGTETAFTSLNRIKVKNMAEKGDKKAELVLNLEQNYDKLLSTILIGNNVVNILASSLATVLFITYFGEELGPTLSTIVVTVIVLIFGEVSPKSLTKERPESFARFSAPFMHLLMGLLTPFTFLFGLWKKLLSKVFKNEEDNTITEDELMAMVEEAESEGGIDEEESKLIRNAIEFTEREASEILTPRYNITAVTSTATKEEIAQVFAETAYSRLPVYQESIDHIEGVIYQKDFHNYVYYTDAPVESIIRPVLMVPENKKISSLLKELQQKKSHIAVVIDEYGGTAGIVTLEDILEEIVGEIWDEHDEVSIEFEKISDEEYKVAGTYELSKLFEELDLEEEEDMPSTLNGFLMNKLERIPVEGDFVEYGGYRFTATQMDDKVAASLKIEKLPPEEETEEEDD